MYDTVFRWRERIARVPWGRVALGTLAVVVLIAVVPPFRRTFTNVSSRIILFAASPFAPSTSGFDHLTRASRVLASDGTEVGLIGMEQREPVRLSQLPPHVPHAVLAAEDANFYHHSGVDPSAVFRAMFNTVAGRPQGGSTITQQLAKLNYTGSNRTLLRKFKEVLYASRLEQRYSKDELLERYLNQVYLGEGAYGIAAASQTFFGIAPQELTPAQAATLAGKIRAPSALDPYARPEEVRDRRDHVLRAMGYHGWLSADGVTEASAEPLDVAERKPTPAGASGRAPHLVRYVGREGSELNELGASAEVRRSRLSTGGYTVETTLDLAAQEAAVEATRHVLGQDGDPTTAVVSVTPADGAIRVLFGGLDETLEFDPASQGRRQPGSAFKPFVYLAMLKAGIDPRATYDAGSPKTVNCRGTPWPVNNYEGKGGGEATADAALAQSINTVYAQIMGQVGPPAVADAAKRAGIADEAVTPPECAMALGGLREGVSPLEQAAAFATFAARGVYAEPYAITRILDPAGKVVFERGGPKTTQAFSSPEAGVLTTALEGVVQNGTGAAAAVGRPMAGKTGTTENYGNAWFIGYVPQLATAVWVGYPEGDVPMTNVHGVSVTGGSFPARIFSAYMREALADVPVQDLHRASPSQLALKGTPKPPPLAPGVSTTTPSAVVTPTAPRPVITAPPPPTTSRRPAVPARPPTPPSTSSPTSSPPLTSPTTVAPSPTTTTTARIT